MYGVEPYRGFESLPLRQLSLYIIENKAFLSKGFFHYILCYIHTKSRAFPTYTAPRIGQTIPGGSPLPQPPIRAGGAVFAKFSFFFIVRVLAAIRGLQALEES